MIEHISFTPVNMRWKTNVFIDSVHLYLYMDPFQEALHLAIKKMRIADHMISVTIPVIKDPKLLIGTVENIAESFKQGLLSILLYEKEMKTIPAFDQNNINQMLTIFQHKIVRRFNLPVMYAEKIREAIDLSHWRKKAPVEFSRKGSYVMCSEKYEIKQLSEKKVKEMVQPLKLFLRDVHKIVMRHERISG